MRPRMIRVAKTSSSAVVLLFFCLLGTESQAQKHAYPTEETKVHVGIANGDIRGNATFRHTWSNCGVAPRAFSEPNGEEQ